MCKLPFFTMNPYFSHSNIWNCLHGSILVTYMKITKVMYMTSVNNMCRLSQVMFMVLTSNTFDTLHIHASPLVCKDTEDNQLYECNDNCAQDYYTVSFCETDAQSIHISCFISQLYFHSVSLCECHMVITVYSVVLSP